MKYIGIQTAILFVLLIAVNHSSYAQMVCMCHSKQPSMKRMHETIGFSGCANCHGKNENLMARRDEGDMDMKAILAARIEEDAFCIPCHGSQGSIRETVYSKKTAIDISGTKFCPKDKMRFSYGEKSCPKCGGDLLNINEVMERSRTQPSNNVCIECHLMEEVRRIPKHTIFNSNKLSMCLDCHEGHDDCYSCHH